MDPCEDYFLHEPREEKLANEAGEGFACVEM